MAAYLKFDGYDGRSSGFTKIEMKRVYPTPPKSAASPRGIQWSATARASLKEAGMTDQGIAALISGRACTNKDDQGIVTAIL